MDQNNFSESNPTQPLPPLRTSTPLFLVAISMLIIGGERALKGVGIQKYEKVPTVWFNHNGYQFMVQLSTPSSMNAA